MFLWQIGRGGGGGGESCIGGRKGGRGGRKGEEPREGGRSGDRDINNPTQGEVTAQLPHQATIHGVLHCSGSEVFRKHFVS